jgi:hypothetical protein
MAIITVSGLSEHADEAVATLTSMCTGWKTSRGEIEEASGNELIMQALEMMVP